jgi:hypothetical protein
MKLLCIILIINLSNNLYAQKDADVYPKIKGPLGILHPLITFSKEETIANFFGIVTFTFLF